MRCPRCGGWMKTVVFKPARCPACGKMVKVIPTLSDIREFWSQFFQGRGVAFWTFISAAFLTTVGMIEISFGEGLMINYLVDHWFISLIFAIFLGAVLDIVARTNVEIRDMASTVTGRLPRALRIWRRGTNISLIIGMVLAVLILHPHGVFEYPPAFVFLIIFFLCCFWAAYSFLLTDNFARDIKLRAFFKRLGVDYVADLRRVSMYYLIGSIFSTILFLTLNGVNGLWLWFSSHPLYLLGTRIVIWADRLLSGRPV